MSIILCKVFMSKILLELFYGMCQKFVIENIRNFIENIRFYSKYIMFKMQSFDLFREKFHNTGIMKILLKIFKMFIVNVNNFIKKTKIFI